LGDPHYAPIVEDIAAKHRRPINNHNVEKKGTGSASKLPAANAQTNNPKGLPQINPHVLQIGLAEEILGKTAPPHTKSEDKNASPPPDAPQISQTTEAPPKQAQLLSFRVNEVHPSNENHGPNNTVRKIEITYFATTGTPPKVTGPWKAYLRSQKTYPLILMNESGHGPAGNFLAAIADTPEILQELRTNWQWWHVFIVDKIKEIPEQWIKTIQEAERAAPQQMPETHGASSPHAQETPPVPVVSRKQSEPLTQPDPSKNFYQSELVRIGGSKLILVIDEDNISQSLYMEVLMEAWIRHYKKEKEFQVLQPALTRTSSREIPLKSFLIRRWTPLC